MQLTTLIAGTIKSGKITVCQNNAESLEIKASKKKIDINMIDKQIVKDIISSVREGTGKHGLKGVVSGINALRGIRPLLEEIVEDLFKEEITLTFSYKGDRVATMGSEANSKLTRFIVGTRHIEINNLAKLVKMNL